MINDIQKACDHQINLPSKCHDLMDKAACNAITENCAEGNCENCPPIDLELIKEKSLFTSGSKETNTIKKS